MGQRSKINPFYIANYKVISLFKSPVGRILQRWRCFGIFIKIHKLVSNNSGEDKTEVYRTEEKQNWTTIGKKLEKF